MTILLAYNTVAEGGKFGELLESLARATRRAKPLKEEAPLLKHADEIRGLRLPRKLDDTTLIRRFERLEGVDDGLRQKFRALPSARRAAMVELGEAAQKVMRRGESAPELLRKLDTDGLALMRTYGDFVAEGVDQMGPKYKLVVRKMGRGAASFYQDWIKPHKGKWLAAGLTTAYLAAPEKFHDALGKLTQYGTRKLTEAGIIAGSSAAEGIWQGLTNRFTQKPLFSGLGIILVIGCSVLLLPRIRWMAWNYLVKPLMTVPKPRKPPPQDHNHPEHFEE